MKEKDRTLIEFASTPTINTITNKAEITKHKSNHTPISFTH
jgi:hypothetical protein